MKEILDDPRLTAYALGELDESERADVEAILAESPEARQWVEEVRQTAQQMTGEMAQEPCPMLTNAQLDAIDVKLDRRVRETQSRAPGTRPASWWPRLRLVEIFVVVGLLAIMAAMFLPALSKAKSKAKRVTSRALLRQFEIEQELGRQELGKRNDFYRVAPIPGFNTESYAPVVENGFVEVLDHPLSTFSIDVDTASYALVRRFLGEGVLPPRDAVRIEEMINYFSYDYPQPDGDDPFTVNVEIAGCPWNTEHRLMRVGLQGREIRAGQRPQCNLVFLIDVSGSMQPANKLPLLKESLKLLVRELSAQDRVGIVAYAGGAGEVLEPTSGSQQRKILRALENLHAGGSTHGSAGIRMAYDLASESYIEGGVNRVILCTDGDFNVGVTSPDALQQLIGNKAASGIFLSVLGFGTGNYKDSTAEMLADKGNGNYAYIDTLDEGRKVLVEQINGTLITIAKDVKLQIEFNPAHASAYRLIGYENRVLRNADFNNDRKDAGEIGAGHTVTALYEIVSPGNEAETPGVDALKYQRSASRPRGGPSDELATIKLRYKEPEGTASKLLTLPVLDTGARYSRASKDFKFASAVAAFGMVLRDSPHKGTATLDMASELAGESLGADVGGYRREFLGLVEQAARASRR